MSKTTKLTPLSEIGEFGLIERIEKDIIITNKSTVKGIGDDAAVIEPEENLQMVVTTDLLVEGIHFDLNYVPLKHLGYKSVMVNASDVCAMNATTRQITVSIAVSNRFSVEAIEELYDGIKLACEKYKIDLIGGDTTSSTKGLIISVTAIGVAKKENITYRNTAKINDLICVSGDLGAAYAGLQLLEREKQVFANNANVQPLFSGYDYILERQLKPEARADVVRLFADKNIRPSAMIDISDGLSSDLLHICNKSGVGCKIFDDKLPIANQTFEFAKEVEIDPTVFALNGGEDYELLFTIPITDYEKIRDVEGISIIGHICSQDEGYTLITKDGSSIPFSSLGWNAFDAENNAEMN